MGNPSGYTLFEIRRRRFGDPISRVFPSGYTSDGSNALKYPRGTALGAHATDVGGGAAGERQQFHRLSNPRCERPGRGQQYRGDLRAVCADQSAGVPFTAGQEIR